MRRRVEQRLPAALPNLLHSSSIRAPLCAAAPLSTSLPSFHQPNPLGSDPATGHIDGILQETKLSRAVLEKPGEFQVLSKALWMKPAAVSTVSASVGDVWSGRTSWDLTK